jgi:hypothetical protein
VVVWERRGQGEARRGRARGEEMEELPQQAKRRRRPSVRLGELGFSAPYDASSLWIEPARQRRKSAPADVLGTGKPSSRSPGAKAPRIRPLEQLAREAAAVVEEDWSVVYPAVADGADGSPAKGKPLRRVFDRKVTAKVRGKGAGWRSKVDAARDVDSPETREDEEDEEEEKEILPLQADDEAPILSTSSDSEELLGSDLKGEEEEIPADDSGNADGSDGSEEGDPGSKPDSHGDEMQGAIEDGPGGVNGKVFSRGRQRQGERRSGRQAAIRDLASREIASRDFASREIASREIGSREIGSRDAVVRDSGNRDVASRDAAGEVSGRAAVANGTTTVVTPNSSQRGVLAAGVSGWLQELGLGKYSELFESNEVDTEVLPHLTFEDLREMGVDAVGARRKMFNGIQELGQIRGI